MLLAVCQLLLLTYTRFGHHCGTTTPARQKSEKARQAAQTVATSQKWDPGNDEKNCLAPFSARSSSAETPALRRHPATLVGSK